MYKDIVLLSKSKKYNNYCVAGKDIDTGEWIRLISEDYEIHNAIRPCDLIYSDGKEAEVLDIIRVKVKEVEEHKKNIYQPENFILNEEYYLNRLGNESFCNLINRIDDYDEYIFFNNQNCITPNELYKYKDNMKSLLLIQPSIVKVKIKDKNRLKANIKYKGKWYNDLTITDTKFINKYYNRISLGINGTNFYGLKLVLSLGELFNGSHYKLIATVLEKEDELIVTKEEEILIFNKIDEPAQYQSWDNGCDYWYYDNDEFDPVEYEINHLIEYGIAPWD